MAETIQKSWICPVCGYVHFGPEPPEFCPVCMAEGALFEPGEGDAAAGSKESVVQRGEQAFIVVGAGIAGVSAAEAIRKAAPEASIRLVSMETQLPYYRLNLTRYLAGEVNAEQLLLHPEAWYREQRIELLAGAAFRSLDLYKKQLALADGQRLAFDKLVLANGAHPYTPPFVGASRKNVTTLRTYADADAILSACQPGMKWVCIGGGILGLEIAGALAQRGVEVTVIENSGWLLTRQLNQRAGEQLEIFTRALGINVRKLAQVQEIAGDEQVHAVVLKDGSVLPADGVVIAAGVRPNSFIARQAGLKTNNGVVVDDFMATSHPDVYAAGDAAEHRGVCYGIWAPAQSQGAIAGMNAAGERAEFAAIPRTNVLKVLGFNLFSIGQIQPEGASNRVLEGEIDGQYVCFVLREQVMVGAIVLGDTLRSGNVKKVIEKQVDLAQVLAPRADVHRIWSYLKTL